MIRYFLRRFRAESSVASARGGIGLLSGSGTKMLIAVGRLLLDWDWRGAPKDHGLLFQPADLATRRSFKKGCENEIILDWTHRLSKPLHQVCDRLDLLGHTVEHCRKEFLCFSKLYGMGADPETYARLCDALTKRDLRSLSINQFEDEPDTDDFCRREIFPRGSGALSNIEEIWPKFEFIDEMENLSAYSLIRLLGTNPLAGRLPVMCSFRGTECGQGTIGPLDPHNRFLVVTERRVDADLIKNAIELFRPHVADFFSYVDMDEGYPFPGTGEIIGFVRGLIKLGIESKVLVVSFSEDDRADARWRELDLPSNIHCIKLPAIGAADENGLLGAEMHCAANTTDANEGCSDLFPASCALSDYTHQRGAAGARPARLVNASRAAVCSYAGVHSALDTIVASCSVMRERELDSMVEDAAALHG